MVDRGRAASATQVTRSPYPGLRAFRQDEAAIFFGRDEQIDSLLDRLERKRLVAVTGESGCGKSSLVHAGLLPALEGGLLGGGGPCWRMVDLRPGDRPIYHLAQKLATVLSSDPAGDAPLLAARLRYGPRSIADILRDFRLPEGTEILIVVDQFEELIRYRAHIDHDEADAFVALLLETVVDQTLPVRVVLTLRTDYLGGCANFAGLPEALNNTQYLVPRLSREQLREVIVKPAHVFDGEVESILANQLINEIGQCQDQLPLLEHALRAMWHHAQDRAAQSTTGTPGTAGPIKLTIADYFALGGISEALSRHADDVYRALGSAEHQRIANRLFCALWDGNATGSDTRRPCTVREAAEITGVSIETMIAVADRFRNSVHSLLMPPPEVSLTEETELDVGHESLFRHWSRLTEWTAKETDDAKQYQFWLNAAYQRAHSNGDLLSDKALERALAWEAALRPTAAWARRYSKQPDDLANVQRLLRDSQGGQGIRTAQDHLALVTGFPGVEALLPSRQNAPTRVTSSHDRDVIFCFAEADNAELPVSGGNGWIDELAECVSKDLQMRGIMQPRILARTHDPLPAAERAMAVQHSATVVVVLSPEFFVSDWDTHPDLRAAIQTASRARPERLIVVERTAVTREQTARFDAHRRCVFWRADRDAIRTLGFPSVTAEPDKQTYYALVSDLAAALAVQLRPLESGAPGNPGRRRRVFLAESTSDVEDHRLEMLRHLERAGLEVVPRGRLPSDPTQFEAEARRLIAESHVFVQLLGAESESSSLIPGAVYRQLEIAIREHREILQWRDPAMEFTAVKAPDLLGLLLRETVHASSIPAFCSAVTAAAQQPEHIDQPEPVVFVDANREEAHRLAQVFAKRYPNVQWVFHEPKRSELKRIVRTVDAVVLYRGDESSERIQQRYYLFIENFKILKKNVKRLLIYNGSLEDKPDFQDSGTSWPGWDRDGSEPAELREFLKDIANAHR